MTEQERTDGQWWHTSGPSVTVSHAGLRERAIGLLEQAGASRDDAAFIADVHLDKALQGDHERGLLMLVTQIRAAISGNVTFGQPLHTLCERDAIAQVEGVSKASPKLVCRDAMALAIAKAQRYGIGCVAVRAQAEILTPFIQQAVSSGLMAMVMAQSVPLVAPHGGVAPLLGNAPLGFGIPRSGGDPVIVDMSLTQTSAKGVSAAAAAGQTISPGLVRDHQGQDTTDPHQLFDPVWLDRGRQVGRGSLVPVGSSHKSYALIFVTGLLTGLLADASFSWELGRERETAGTFSTLFVVIDPSAFGDREAILKRVNDYIVQLETSPRREESRPVHYPGQRSQELKRQRRNADRLTIPVSHLEAFKALTV